MVLQVKAFDIIGENALIRVIKTNNHTISIIINSEHIFIQRFVRITYKTRNAIVVIQCPNKRSISGSSICRNQPFSRKNIKNVGNKKRLPFLFIQCRKHPPVWTFLPI